MLGVVTICLMGIAWRYRQHCWLVLSCILALTIVGALLFDDTAQWAVILTGAMMGLIVWPLMLGRVS